MLFTFAYEAAGASDTRLSLRPRCSKGEEFRHHSGVLRCGKAALWLGGVPWKSPPPPISCINIRRLPQALGHRRAMWYPANTLSTAICDRPRCPSLVAAVEIF